MRQLLLMRHAKSDWDADYDRDHERPLNNRGVRSAKLMGRMLAGMGLDPLLVISSTAVRARITAQLAAQAGSWSAPIQLDRVLYEGAPDDVIERAAETPDVERLMLVGHQPTWSLLVEVLSGARTEMKTASVAVIDLNVERWSDLSPHTGELTTVHHARDYFGSDWDQR